MLMLHRHGCLTLTGSNNRCSFGVRYDNDVYQKEPSFMGTSSRPTFDLTQRLNQLDQSEHREEILEALCKTRTEIADALTIILMKAESLQERVQSIEDSQDDHSQLSSTINDIMEASRLMQRRIEELDACIDALREG